MCVSVNVSVLVRENMSMLIDRESESVYIDD